MVSLLNQLQSHPFGQGREDNPWAILNCLRSGEFGSYWWASGTPGMLVDLAATLQRPDGDLEGVKATDMSLLFDITQPTAEPLAQIKARRYYEPYLTDPRPIILLAAGGFEDQTIQCLWEDALGACRT